MAYANERRPCAKCKTAGGIAICDGCQQSFCSNHFIEHRQDLSLEMDTIGQNYDLLRRDLHSEPAEHPLVTRINTWEQESIRRIQKTAEIARAHLQKLTDEVKSDLETSALIAVTEIKSSRDSKDYTENDFKRWIDKLNEIRRAFEAPFNVHVENDTTNETTIGLIRVTERRQTPESPVSTIQENHFSTTDTSSIFVNDEKFDSKTDAILSDNNLRATCVPKYSSPAAIVLGFNTYLCGAHDISFRIEKKGLSRLFFGVYSGTRKRIDSITGYENSVYGWWDIDSNVINGTKQETSNEHIIITGDKIVLTLDCNRQLVQLYHVRENRTVQLVVDINKCPYPWKIIVKLTANGDCVRIL